MGHGPLGTALAVSRLNSGHVDKPKGVVREQELRGYEVVSTFTRATVTAIHAMVNASRAARTRQATGRDRAGVQVSDVMRAYTADVAIATTMSMAPIRAATMIPIADAMAMVIRKARTFRARVKDS